MATHWHQSSDYLRSVVETHHANIADDGSVQTDGYSDHNQGTTREGRDRKGREGKARDGKGREGKGMEGNGRKWKGR